MKQPKASGQNRIGRKKPTRAKYSNTRQQSATRRAWLVAGAVAVAAILVVTLSLTGRKKSGGGDQSSVLAEGSPAPAVVLPATTGATVNLADYRGKRNVLLYFYEHAG